jgi:hypothetical protein
MRDEVAGFQLYTTDNMTFLNPILPEMQVGGSSVATLALMRAIRCVARARINSPHVRTIVR